MNANVLIIDDSLVSTQFFKNVLEKENHFVVTSHSGKNIIDLIDEHCIDIVLLDIIMPDISGYDVLQLMQSTDRTRDIPVIMITVLSSPLEVKRALDYGALDFIRKTSEPIEVIARVNSAIRLKQKQDLLKENALRDALTGLYNRRYFNLTIEKLIEQKSDYSNGVALILLDCDFFKNVNDQFGHASGDEVLAGIAEVMVQSIKSTDIAFRFGGEEFCLLLPNVTAFQAFMIAERIRTNIQKTSFVFNGQNVFITVSCGVSHMKSGDGKSDVMMLNEADAALYTAKDSGRNYTILFSEDLKTK